MKNRLLFLISLFLIPSLASAMTLKELVDSLINSVGNAVLLFLTTIATVFFFYGIARYIFAVRTGEPKKIQEGNTFLIWGTVSLFVMLSAWGIVYLAQDYFGIKESSAVIDIPSSINFDN
jgi:hypothetical protein